MLLVLLAASAACSTSNTPADSATAAAARTASGPQKVGGKGGINHIGVTLDSLLKDKPMFDSVLGAALADTPLQEISEHSAKKANPACPGAPPRLWTQAFATSGVYSYADLTTNGGGFAYLVGRIQNVSKCLPVGLPIPPTTTTTDTGAVLIFVAPSTTTAGTYQVRFIDPATRADIGSTIAEYKECAAASTPKWYGDHHAFKKAKNICDHAPPSNSLIVLDDEDYALWLSCGSNCCYADPGIKNGPDSTHKDSTHRDTTKKPAPLKKA